MKWLIYIAFMIPSLAMSQGGVGYIFEELPNDSVPERSLQLHTSVKPAIRVQSRAEKGNFSSLDALVDLNYLSSSTDSYSLGQYKLGLGAQFESYLNEKWYFRLAAVQGVHETDPIYSPKSYINRTSPGSYEHYTDIRSRVSFTPNHVFNFQAGLDHNFIGEGSRSLFLSDYGKPYPFGMIRMRFWRLEYSILYQFMREGEQDDWTSKFASTHHLSFNAAKWLNIGLFETIIFQPTDTLLQRGFDAEYLNPFVFYRPQEYSLGSSDNVLLGIDATVKLKKISIYTQFVLDEFVLSEIRSRSRWWANKYGLQLGAKGRFKKGEHRFFYRGELNVVRPYTYAHKSEDYNHGNQGTALAHPNGADFAEVLAELKWQKGKLGAKFFSSYILQGGDADGFNYGADIYVPYINRPFEYGHTIGGGNQTNTWISALSFNYQIMKRGNLNAFMEHQFKVANQTTNQTTNQYLFVVGIRSWLWNDYRNY